MEASVPPVPPEPPEPVDLWADVEPAASRRIVLAAIDAFAERGYHATTTRDIALRAGLSPAALYVHHPSKAALLALISRIGHDRALALVEQADAGTSEPTTSAGTRDPVQRLHDVVLRFVEWHAEHHRVARVVQYELAALPPDDWAAVTDRRRRIESVVTAILQAGTEQGRMDVDEPRRVARAILSLSVDVARWYDPAGRDTPADLGGLYAELAVRMTQPTSPPAGSSRTRGTQ